MIKPEFTFGVLGIRLLNNKVLMAYTEYDRPKWQLIGGFVKSNENPFDALKREYKEELSVNVEIKKFIGVYIGGYDNNITLLFKVEFPDGSIVIDNEELIEIKYFGFDEIPENISERTRSMIEDTISDLNPVVRYFLHI